MLNQLGLNRNLVILCATMYLNVFARFMWDAILPLHLRALGANAQEIGLAFTGIFIARTFFAMVGGALADRFGRARLAGVLTFLMGVFLTGAGLSADWQMTVAALIAMNAFSSMQWPPLSALITESSGEEHAARSYSFTEASVLFGLITGPLIGAGLLGIFGVSTLIILSGIITALTGIVRFWGLRETVRKTPTSTRLNLRAALTRNLLWIIVLGALFAFANALTFGPFFAILARDAWGNTEAEINLLFSVGSAAALVGILLGRTSTRFGARRVLALSALGMGISAALWGLAPTWQWGIVPLVIAFVASESLFIAQASIQAAVTTRESRSSVYGLISTTTGLVGGFAPTIGAWFITLGGNAVPFLAAGLAGLLIIAAVMPVKTQDPQGRLRENPAGL